MYGYSFGAAKADVWHKWDDRAMLYPGYVPPPHPPRILHYGLTITVNHTGGTWTWHKQDNGRFFDVKACPPWNLGGNGGRPQVGLFEFPPHPKDLLFQVSISTGARIPYMELPIAGNTID